VKEIAEMFPVNWSSAYKSFKIGLATLFVVSRLHSNRLELNVSAVAAWQITFSQSGAHLWLPWLFLVIVKYSYSYV